MHKTIDTSSNLAKLIEEQKARTDPEYIAAVNNGIQAAIEDIDKGNSISHEDFWKEFET